MQKLKLVKQLDQCGCTIACLAMILDISYFEVRAKLHNIVNSFKNRYVSYTHIGLQCVEMQKILELEFAKPCKFIKFLSLNKLKRHCMLYICPLEGGYETTVHAVMFDAKSRQIMDPDVSRLTDLNNYNVICCIEIA